MVGPLMSLYIILTTYVTPAIDIFGRMLVLFCCIAVVMTTVLYTIVVLSCAWNSKMMINRRLALPIVLVNWILSIFAVVAFIIGKLPYPAGGGN